MKGRTMQRGSQRRHKSRERSTMPPTHEYAFDFGFNLGEVQPPASARATSMMWGMAYRTSTGTCWSAWQHLDPRKPICNGSVVRIYVCNIGSTTSGVSVGGPKLFSRMSARPDHGQTATTPWEEREPPTLTGGSVDGDHKATGLGLAGVPHRLVGQFTAINQGRFPLTLLLAIAVEGENQAYVFSQDPELVVGGASM